MSRLIGYFANQTDRIRCALTLEAPALAFGSGRVEAWGVGSYQGGEVLLRKRPSEPRGAAGILDLVRDLRTGCGVAHAREGGAAARTIDNTQPFRYRQWLFAHVGALPNFAETRAAIRALVPEHLARNVRGGTDSELLFHAFLGAVHRTGRLDDPELDRGAIAAALAETVDAVDRACGPGATLNLVVTHGHAMVALRRGLPLSWLRRHGIRDCEVCRRAPEISGREPRRVNLETLRYVVIAGDAAAPGEEWQDAPDAPRGAVVAVDRNLDVKVESL